MIITKQDCLLIGTLVKAFGHKGEIILSVSDDVFEECKKLESVFVEINNKLVPFFITHIDIKQGSSLGILFEDIDTPEKARELIGKNVYVLSSLLPKLPDTKFYYNEIVGFSVIDKKKKFIGHIVRIDEMPAQAIFIIEHDRHEILIPITEKTFIRVDRKKKELYIDAPEGLIDLYIK